jgi:hypothetical protein
MVPEATLTMSSSAPPPSSGSLKTPEHLEGAEAQHSSSPAGVQLA